MAVAGIYEGWHLFKRNIRGCFQSNPPSGLKVVSLGRFVVCERSLMRLRHLVYGGRRAAWFGWAVWRVRTWVWSRLDQCTETQDSWVVSEQSGEHVRFDRALRRHQRRTMQSCTLTRGFYWSILSLWMVADEVIFIFHCAVWFATFPFAQANALKALSSSSLCLPGIFHLDNLNSVHHLCGMNY